MKLLQAAGVLASVAAALGVAYAVGRIARWQAGRHDPIETLIKPPRWCRDGKDGYMNAIDQQKAERAGERRWQETLRAQRKTRKKVRVTAPLRHVIEIVKRRSA
mgnify:CR=1 FL=1